MMMAKIAAATAAGSQMSARLRRYYKESASCASMKYSRRRHAQENNTVTSKCRRTAIAVLADSRAAGSFSHCHAFTASAVS